MREINRREDAKRRSAPEGRLDDAVSRGVHRGLTKGLKAGRKWLDLLGFDVIELMAHLEKKFKTGMKWENYGVGGWEIDHVVPRSAFNYSSPDDIDFKKCWSLSNLQPMWASENRSKKDKLKSHFQPSLRLTIPANDNAKTAERSVDSK